jgi:ketosteroid isomerase-like protein
MKRYISLLIFVIFIIVLTGDNSKSSVSQESTPGLKMAIAQLIKYYEEEDIKELRKIYSPGITIFLPYVPFRVEGISSLENELEQYFKDYSRIKISLRQVNVDIKDGIGIEDGYYSFNSVYRNEPLAMHGRYTRLWERNSEGNWICFHEHMSYLPIP